MSQIKDELRIKMLAILQSNDFDATEIDSIKTAVLKSKDTNLKISLAYLFDRWSNKIESVLDEKDVDEQFKAAFEKKEEATRLNPNYDKYYYNWGVALGNYAKFKTGEEKEKIKLLEIEKYKLAIALNNNFDSSYYNLGQSLMKIGITKESNQAIQLLQESITKLEKAISINLWHTSAWNSLGTAYSYLAEFDTKNATKWYEKSIYIYSELTDIMSYNGNAHDNLGIALKDLALLKKNPERDELLLQAIQKHLIAIQQGSGTYNLACTYAVMGDERNAFLHLKRAIETKDVQVEEVFEDSDWTKYLANKEFKTITSNE